MPIASARMTSKGQITLPAKLRAELGLKPGDRLDFERNKKGRIELAARTLKFEDLRGILKTDKVYTDDEIVEMSRGAWGERWERLKRQDGE